MTYDLQNNFLFRGSKQLIKHIIHNLIQNSIKHAGININIHVKIEGNSVYLKDDGKGIDPENIHKIFKSFYTGTRNGHGIGLSFCHAVMHSMNGQIRCSSKVGEYTEFILSFPQLYKDDD